MGSTTSCVWLQRRKQDIKSSSSDVWVDIRLKTEMEKLAFFNLCLPKRGNEQTLSVIGGCFTAGWTATQLHSPLDMATSVPSSVQRSQLDIYQTAACCSLWQGTDLLHQYHQASRSFYLLLEKCGRNICLFSLFLSPTVPERPHVGGENHERPGLQQGQRGGLQRVCGAGGRAHRRLQRLLPGAEEESQVAPTRSCILPSGLRTSRKPSLCSCLIVCSVSQ